MEYFSQLTQETLEYYVYLLINPLDNKIFYVGKGKNNRVFNHAKAMPLSWLESDKLDIIRTIINKGEKVKYYILRHGMSEDEAYLVESAFIDFLTFKDFSFVANISNIVAGHNQWDKGLKTVEEIELLYNCLPLDVENKPHKLLCININGTYQSSADIYEITRKSWVLNPNRANRADFVVAEYRGIIRAIFKIDEKGWQRVESRENKEYFKGKSKARYYFEGKEVLDKEIQEIYLNKRLPPKPQGQSNPVWYLD